MNKLNKKITMLLTLLVFFVAFGCQNSSRGKKSVDPIITEGETTALPTITIVQEDETETIVKIESEAEQIYYGVISNEVVTEEDGEGEYEPSSAYLLRTCATPCEVTLNDKIDNEGTYYIFAVASKDAAFATAEGTYPEKGTGWEGPFNLAKEIEDQDEDDPKYTYGYGDDSKTLVSSGGNLGIYAKDDHDLTETATQSLQIKYWASDNILGAGSEMRSLLTNTRIGPVSGTYMTDKILYMGLIPESKNSNNIARFGAVNNGSTLNASIKSITLNNTTDFSLKKDKNNGHLICEKEPEDMEPSIKDTGDDKKDRCYFGVHFNWHNNDEAEKTAEIKITTTDNKVFKLTVKAKSTNRTYTQNQTSNKLSEPAELELTTVVASSTLGSSPDLNNFNIGNINYNSSTDVKLSIRIKNEKNVAATINSVSIIKESEYTVSNNCNNKTLATAGSTCDFKISLNKNITVPGKKTATVTVTTTPAGLIDSFDVKATILSQAEIGLKQLSNDNNSSEIKYGNLAVDNLKIVRFEKRGASSANIKLLIEDNSKRSAHNIFRIMTPPATNNDKCSITLDDENTHKATIVFEKKKTGTCYVAIKGLKQSIRENNKFDEDKYSYTLSYTAEKAKRLNTGTSTYNFAKDLLNLKYFLFSSSIYPYCAGSSLNIIGLPNIPKFNSCLNKDDEFYSSNGFASASKSTYNAMNLCKALYVLGATKSELINTSSVNSNTLGNAFCTLNVK